jgi:hypothetical protein
MVPLKGPVRSEDEKRAIDDEAARIGGYCTFKSEM